LTQQTECLAKESLEQLLASNKSKLRLIDVRNADEYAANHIPNAINIPIEDLADHLDEIDRGKRVVTICWKGGGRSAAAVELLKANGFTQAQYLCGGTLGWLNVLQ
jgi:rhodanese-related sulfurtransferase